MEVILLMGKSWERHCEHGAGVLSKWQQWEGQRVGYSHVLLWHDLKEKLKHEAVTAVALGSSPSGVWSLLRERMRSRCSQQLLEKLSWRRAGFHLKKAHQQVFCEKVEELGEFITRKMFQWAQWEEMRRSSVKESRNGNTAVREREPKWGSGLPGLAFCLGAKDQRHDWIYWEPESNIYEKILLRPRDFKVSGQLCVLVGLRR